MWQKLACGLSRYGQLDILRTEKLQVLGPPGEMRSMDENGATPFVSYSEISPWFTY
ncbi:hypothetical protein PILCRDRAFT_816424 [Piloderma croceum F 1598]|uniref:Uncharacterized protein n=1 Tax=Piloderma croceum (strain F 1598) TaxID=765440 RepID=A0A0C3C9S7_PILCF|nr:hypothetical protein PILCRDRAFT_816424 [Piloderma croceum F 1598]